MLAEDNPVNQMIIARMLMLEGFEVEVVGNGEEAVASVTESDSFYDAIFMDVQMPTMDGLSASKLIRERLERPPPIVAITANTQENDIAEYKKAGMDVVLGKPLDRAKLRRVLEKLAAPQTE